MDSTLFAFAGMLAGFFAIAKIMLTQASKDRNADREERIRFSDAIEKMAKGMDNVANTNAKIAEATDRGSTEAKERNGHLAELVEQSTINVITAVQGGATIKKTK